MGQLDDMDNIWEATIDNRFKCSVVRSEDYTGKLIIVDTEDEDKIIHKTDVSLSYGAMFGPDVSDISEWEEICINIVDEFAKSEII